MSGIFNCLLALLEYLPLTVVQHAQDIVPALASQLALLYCAIIILRHAGQPVGRTRPEQRSSSYYILYKQNPCQYCILSRVAFTHALHAGYK